MYPVTCYLQTVIYKIESVISFNFNATQNTFQYLYSLFFYRFCNSVFEAGCLRFDYSIDTCNISIS